MRRLSTGVIQGVCKYAEGLEVPDMFAVWSGLAIVAAALGRDCFIDYGYFAVYPNMYIILVAGSAVCRKSTAIRLATTFISKVSPKINTISQKATTEGLIGTLSGMMGEEGATVLVPSAVGIALLSELSTFVNKSNWNTDLIDVLTDLYDAEDFEYVTRGRGKELVKNPCLSIFGGTTMQKLREVIPYVAIGGGFTSRIMFIYQNVKGRLIPWPSLSDVDKKMEEDISHDVNEIAKMRGQFAIDADAKKMYEDEYSDFYSNNAMLKHEHLSGYAGRRHHMVLKTAMLISASRSDNRLIIKDDMRIALDLIRKAEEHMEAVFRKITSQEVGDVFEEILNYIMNRKIVSYPELIKRFRHKMTSDELKVMMRTLEEEGIVRSEVEGANIRYIFVR